jgi:hypothetical protein
MFRFALLGLLALAAPAQAQPQPCTEMRARALQSWELFRRGGEPSHRAAAQNYDNAYAAMCRPGAGGGGGSAIGGGDRNLATAQAVLGMVGAIAGIMAERQRRDAAEMAALRRLDEIRAEEARMRAAHQAARARAEDDARRCALPNPFGGASNACDPNRNPFDEDRRRRYDSVLRRLCSPGVLMEPNCIPDDTRALLARMAGRTQITANYRPADYSTAVISESQYRRLMQGATLADIQSENDSAWARRLEADLLRDLDRRLAETRRRAASGGN